MLFRSQEAVVADVDEPCGQDMEEEPAYELHSVETHRSLAVAVSVVFPSEADLAVFE